MRKAVRLKPDSDKYLNSLAWLLATATDASLRDGVEAVELSEHAARLTEFKNSSILDTLAAAYAEGGRFAEAVETAQKALDLATAAGNDTLAMGVRTRLETYKSGQPCRE